MPWFGVTLMTVRPPGSVTPILMPVALLLLSFFALRTKVMFWPTLGVESLTVHDRSTSRVALLPLTVMLFVPRRHPRLGWPSRCLDSAPSAV